MLRIALIGCGEHSKTSHAAPLARYAAAHPGEIALSAVCDLNLARAEEFRRTYGFARAYSRLDEMLAREKLDGCVTIMPVQYISTVGVELLKRGLPCVLEKPLGATIEQVEELARVAEETGTPHMVSVNRRFIPYLRSGFEWIGGRQAIRFLRATIIRHERAEEDFIWTTAIHGVDTLRHLAGEITDYQVRSQFGGELSSRWYHFTFQFANGAFASLDVLPTAGLIDETYEMYGENRSARIATVAARQQSLRCWRGNQLAVEEIADLNEDEDLLNGAYVELENFIALLRDHSRPHPTVGDVLPSVRLCFEAARETSD